MENLVTLFHRAVKENQYEATHSMLQQGMDPNESDWDNCGRQALEVAVYHGYADLARLLLEHGADPSASNAQGETALHVSLHPHTFSKDMVELLIQKSKDIDAQEKFYGYSALHLSSRICVSSSNNKVRSDMMDIMKLLCDKADVNLCSKRGETALHRVTSGSQDNVDAVKLLIDNGVDLDIQNERGETGLMCAIDKGHSAVAEMLIKSGCNLNLMDRHVQTALHRCAQKNRQRILESLLMANADPSVADLNGDTVLHVASSKGLQDMVRVLVYHSGVDVNARNAMDLKPLHIAVESGFTKVVEVLLEAECEIEDGDNDIFTTDENDEDEYVRPCHPEICSMLRDAIEQRKDWEVGFTSL